MSASGGPTPAIRALTRAGVDHTVHAYRSAAGGAGGYGEEAAAQLGLDPARVYKTLLAQLDTGALVVALVPVDSQLDLKALAKAGGAKSAAMAAPAEAERSTGYVVGGISPLGQRKRLPAFVDTGMTAWPTVYVSAGRRGLEIELAPSDLVALTKATPAPIAR